MFRTTMFRTTRTTRTTARIGRLAGALVAGTLVLAGCSDDSTAGSRADDGAASSSEEAATTFNEVDYTFAQGMLPHHQQAVEMAQLCQGRTENPQVLDLASRIEAAQQPEIETLTGWLEEWESGEGMGHDSGEMDHGSMAGGMMSPEQMQAMMSASGAEFDRLFLEGMIEHHRGAVAMAETEIAEGRNPEAIAMAESVRDSQQAEIDEMEQLLAGATD